MFGTAWLGAGTWWLFVSLHRYGGLPAWMAALAVLRCWRVPVALPRGGMAGSRAAQRRRAADARCSPRSGCSPNWRAASFFTGFPWVASGYAQVDSPLAGSAPWLGVYGIGAAAAGLAAWAALATGAAAAGWRCRAALGAASALLARAAAAAGFTGRRGTLTVTLLQGNIPQDEKFATDPCRRRWSGPAHALADGARRPRRRAGDRVPLLPQPARPTATGRRCRPLSGRRQAALFGLPLGDEAGYTNSAAGISARPAPGGSTATTSTTWCRSASSSRPASAGSRG